MRKDKTEITLINPRQSNPPSLWANMFTLIALFGLMVGAKNLSDRWLNQTPKPEDEETQIILEDLESEQPLAESASLVMPEAQTESVPAEEVKTEAPIAGVQETPPAEQIAPELAKQAVQETKLKKKIAKRKTKKVVKKVAKPKVIPAYAQPDPYTDGGPLDLDRREQQVIAIPPTPVDERDH